ncbi:hypothetical protein JI435_415730, partial [Parastagonospora nodorum SN15]
KKRRTKSAFMFFARRREYTQSSHTTTGRLILNYYQKNPNISQSETFSTCISFPRRVSRTHSIILKIYQHISAHPHPTLSIAKKMEFHIQHHTPFSSIFSTRHFPF